jgi:hypothetical protein
MGNMNNKLKDSRRRAGFTTGGLKRLTLKPLAKLGIHAEFSI